ncbi:hypothetical protein [Lelliottia sp. CFBP8978]|uniref:hypothetical protein n=1 Tax=Lelliottia sp. CFBP8978 TaxID=3096522 RepID=UPI002A6B4F14|nr:hypothetical protein [Lelliottia sp. CFBP8978]MDY1036758.1 hypothetical protein [Lelliottia sp. CFBP8978]
MLIQAHETIAPASSQAGTLIKPDVDAPVFQAIISQTSPIKDIFIGFVGGFCGVFSHRTVVRGHLFPPNRVVLYNINFFAKNIQNNIPAAITKHGLILDQKTNDKTNIKHNHQNNFNNITKNYPPIIHQN